MKLVGWDVDDKKREFWILENNWGNTWGEEGMARLYIGFKEFNIEDLVIAPIINPIYVSNLNTI
jgi:C1A family cysteine protease